MLIFWLSFAFDIDKVCWLSQNEGRSVTSICISDAWIASSYRGYFCLLSYSFTCKFSILDLNAYFHILQLESQEYGSSEDDYADNDDCGYGYEEQEPLADKLKQTINDNAIEDLEPEDGYKAPADLLWENDALRSKKLQESATDLIHCCAKHAKKKRKWDQGQGNSAYGRN